MFSAFVKMEFPFRNPVESPSVITARFVPLRARSQGMNDTPHISQPLYQTYVWKAEVVRGCKAGHGWS